MGSPGQEQYDTSRMNDNCRQAAAYLHLPAGIDCQDSCGPSSDHELHQSMPLKVSVDEEMDMLLVDIFDPQDLTAHSQVKMPSFTEASHANLMWSQS